MVAGQSSGHFCAIAEGSRVWVPVILTSASSSSRLEGFQAGGPVPGSGLIRQVAGVSPGGEASPASAHTAETAGLAHAVNWPSQCRRWAFGLYPGTLGWRRKSCPFGYLWAGSLRTLHVHPDQIKCECAAPERLDDFLPKGKAMWAKAAQPSEYPPVSPLTLVRRETLSGVHVLRRHQPGSHELCLVALRAVFTLVKSLTVLEKWPDRHCSSGSRGPVSSSGSQKDVTSGFGDETSARQAGAKLWSTSISGLVVEPYGCPSRRMNRSDPVLSVSDPNLEFAGSTWSGAWSRRRNCRPWRLAGVPGCRPISPFRAASLLSSRHPAWMTKSARQLQAAGDAVRPSAC